MMEPTFRRDLPNPEPLRTAEWIHEHVLGGGEDIDVAWIKKHVPCVRLSRKVRRYRESMVREWLKSLAERPRGHTPKPPPSLRRP